MSAHFAPRLTAIACLIGSVALAGCSDTNTSSAADRSTSADANAVGLALPKRLLQTRAIDRSQLMPLVTLSTGQNVPMRRVDDTLWSGTVQVQPGQDIDVSVEWVGRLERGDLPLARLVTRRVPVGAEGGALSVGTGEYDYDIDFDGDGIDNLTELEAGDDPFGGIDFVPVADAPDSRDEVEPEVEPENEPDEQPEDEPEERPDDEPDDQPEDDEPVVEESSGPEQEPPPGVDMPEDDEPPVESVTANVDVFVPRIARSRAPRIDGSGVQVDGRERLVGEWLNAVQVDSGGSALGVNNLMIDLGAEAASGTPFRRWAALHDGEYLYVLVIVEDDGQRYSDSELFWKDDSMELFIDGDLGRRSAYGDDDDFHLILPLLEPGGAPGSKVAASDQTTGWLNGPFSSGVGIDLNFVTGPGIGPDGLQRPRFEQDVYELRIALDSINVTPGEPFGFELQINDDDDGGTRDSKWGWAHPARQGEDVDFTYLDPSFMGTLQLD